MEAARTPVPGRLRQKRVGSGQLLHFASDQSLVDRVRTGNELAFSAI
jgi:hypothetical protein